MPRTHRAISGDEMLCVPARHPTTATTRPAKGVSATGEAEGDKGAWDSQARVVDNRHRVLYRVANKGPSHGSRCTTIGARPACSALHDRATESIAFGCRDSEGDQDRLGDAVPIACTP